MADPLTVRGTPLGSGATDHARGAYLPEAGRQGTALCLSGGGYRAALFHLGGLRRLNELGILTRIDTFSAVSGGSIVAAHLARQAAAWPATGMPVPAWEERVARPFRAFCRRNIRTGAVARRLLPWHWRESRTAVAALAEQYARRLLPTRFSELPDRPRFVFCATDLAFGVNWVFDSGVADGVRGRLGDYQAGYVRPIPDWPVALAVAASSCFPPVFDPLPVDLDPTRLLGGRYAEADRHELVAGIRLSDGGVYDNLGLEPVWKDHAVVLVSDGAASSRARPTAGCSGGSRATSRSSTARAGRCASGG